MLCSRCSEIVKPVAAVDIDGTLGDYHRHFLAFSCSYFDEAIGAAAAGSYAGDRPFSEWWMEIFGLGRKDWHEVKLAYRQGGMKRTMPLLPGAKRLCRSIRSKGAELWLTTTRPYLSLDSVLPDTLFWLKRSEIDFDGMLFDEDKYEQLAQRVSPERVVAVFDDLPEMVDAANAQFPDKGWLVVGEWNKAVTRYQACTLGDASWIAEDRIEDWRSLHGSV